MNGEAGLRQADSPTLLEVRDVSVDLASSPGASLNILTHVAFDIEPGRIVGLFGQSGSGKTTLALALLNLLSPARYRVRGEIWLNGRNILTLPSRRLEQIRGAEIAMVFQDPFLSLNPVLRVGFQVAEVLRAHGGGNGGSSPDGSLDTLFQLVGLSSRSARIAAAYPHQLSGGERQRVAIAQALACRPALVVADEPFTALDPTRVVELAGLFHDLRQKLHTSFLLISHSPGVLAAVADSVLVMRDGRIVERGTPRQVFESPADPYIAGLLRAAPHFGRPSEGIADVR